MKDQTKFWDWMAARYARQPVADEAIYQEKLTRTRQYFGQGCRVLECGCGTGSTAIAHAPHVGHIHATDISANMLAIAREKASAAGVSNISFEQADLRHSGGETANWDVILGMSILHLVPDMTGDITLVHSLLKPGGVFVSSSPCIADMSTFFRYVAPLFRWLPFLPSVTVFSRSELEDSLKNAGFVIETSWQPGDDKAVFIVARKPSSQTTEA
ncbi:MAG: methyltransferase domain-containing protein [Haliea sp.]|nr:methyltransferase domain-containing protein [Haliea sp.]